MTGIEFNSRLARIPVYPAAESYEYDGELVKLASNETPFGPPAAVIGTLQGNLERLNRYPDPEKTALRRAIAERTGLPAAQVAVGNGSCEILLAAADALLEPGAELVYAWPSFSMYVAARDAVGRDRHPGAGRRRRLPRPRRDARGDHRRDPARADLQPEQPDGDRAAGRRDRRVRRATCRATSR